MSASGLISLFDAETTEAVEGLHWLPVRRALDVGAFGVNAFRAERAGDPVIEEHEESPGRRSSTSSSAVARRSRSTARTATLPPARRSSSTTRRSRSAVAAEDATWRSPSSAGVTVPITRLREPIYLAAPEMRSGDWSGAAATIEREAGDQRVSAPVRYRLAACTRARPRAPRDRPERSRPSRSGPRCANARSPSLARSRCAATALACLSGLARVSSPAGARSRAARR